MYQGQLSTGTRFIFYVFYFLPCPVLPYPPTLPLGIGVGAGGGCTLFFLALSIGLVPRLAPASTVLPIFSCTIGLVPGNLLFYRPPQRKKKQKKNKTYTQKILEILTYQKSSHSIH